MARTNEGDHPFSKWSSPTKSYFSPILKIWYIHFQRIFFVVIKLTPVIQFLCLSKICWKWELTILVKMLMGTMNFSRGKFDLGELWTQNWGKWVITFLQAWFKEEILCYVSWTIAFIRKMSFKTYLSILVLYFLYIIYYKYTYIQVYFGKLQHHHMVYRWGIHFYLYFHQHFHLFKCRNQHGPIISKTIW